MRPPEPGGTAGLGVSCSPFALFENMRTTDTASQLGLRLHLLSRLVKVILGGFECFSHSVTFICRLFFFFPLSLRLCLCRRRMNGDVFDTVGHALAMFGSVAVAVNIFEFLGF